MIKNLLVELMNDTGAYGEDGEFVEKDRFFNQKLGSSDESYKGQQYWYMYGKGGMFGGGNVDRHSPDFLNERENFFHKPLVNLNHYLTLNDNMRLSSILYYGQVALAVVQALMVM